MAEPRQAGAVEAQAARPRTSPMWNIVLLDDDDHTYDYVVEMLSKLFRFSSERAFQLAVEVDKTGRVVVETTTRERAELKREQIQSFGADWRLDRSQGSMTAQIEPVT
ncbi:MAG: ATP-dependent Clp protease adaptor ClpS [Phycisphaerae bacterium]